MLSKEKLEKGIIAAKKSSANKLINPSCSADRSFTCTALYPFALKSLLFQQRPDLWVDTNIGRLRSCTKPGRMEFAAIQTKSACADLP